MPSEENSNEKAQLSQGCQFFFKMEWERVFMLQITKKYVQQQGIWKLT